MTKVKINSNAIDIIYHKTHEISEIIYPEKCDLIITMNATNSLLRSIADKNSQVYFVSTASNPKRFVGNAQPVLSTHYKVYRTPTRVIFSTANASLSSFDELSFVFNRTSELDQFIKLLIMNLKKVDRFIRAFY